MLVVCSYEGGERRRWLYSVSVSVRLRWSAPYQEVLGDEGGGQFGAGDEVVDHEEEV